MKKIFALICALSFITMAQASDKTLTVLTKGEGFKYPIKNGSMIECYAKDNGGSVNAFKEYNDYFKMIDGKLYSDTMNRIYKPEKSNKWKKVDSVKIYENGILKMYDPLWEGSIRHHMRRITINTKNGAYAMKGTQDNWMWYRNMIAKGYCRVIKAK